ncbi:lymphocyte antigen 6S [Oryctolagus cuniculus]|uniref:lymphocyte antigen 6S n=1 Tax=Oryctolagus cuniculus TaxID=9986 RepID=UPI0022329EDE|nr:lymphocyte antigen 6A-2/6E-1 [Oryctolagus cuniculus]
MKPSAVVLLLALLCAQRARGLRCYQCLGTSVSSSCGPALCLYPDGVCVTQEVVTTVGLQTVREENKFCLPQCPRNTSVPVQILDFTSRLTCCKGDLCNAAPRAADSAWTLPWGLLCSLGSVLWVLF